MSLQPTTVDPNANNSDTAAKLNELLSLASSLAT